LKRLRGVHREKRSEKKGKRRRYIRLRMMADDVDEVIDETEAEENITAEGISEPEALSSIQKACLEFCIALLSQLITRKEYDSLLVCALAMLGVKEDGWKGAEQYPPISSAVIKVARFMVVQQALQLSEPFNNEFDSDSARP
jgi:hypothetical protein